MSIIIAKAMNTILRNKNKTLQIFLKIPSLLESFFLGPVEGGRVSPPFGEAVGGGAEIVVGSTGSILERRYPALIDPLSDILW